MSVLSEFLDFMREYKILTMAIAFIMGVAATGLVKSFVDNLIMPWVNALTPTGDWKEAVLSIGPVSLGIGPFAAELINFIIIALVVFLIAKYIMKEELVTKK
jgi:large conductance mechanosensitive channel